MKAHFIIGKNFGDEGKGLATDFFASRALEDGMPCLVVRHNGGAQAGHTVDTHDARFVFHQLSAGSFRRADTFWADSFLPDLFKLSEEEESFFSVSRFTPRILSFGGCRCVVIDDVLVNMLLETSRGDRRHGSCGMGIDEAVQRSSHHDCLVTLRDVKSMTASDLYRKLKRIRREYLPERLRLLGISLSSDEYSELLMDDNVVYHAAEGMCRGVQRVELIEREKLADYGEVVFEGAQGLLLDEMYLDYAPHLTSSRTGLGQPLSLCRELFPSAKTQAVYVTRSYVTRHGRGPLPYDGAFDLQRYPVCDLTNIPNEWQLSLRFAPHGTYREFIEPVQNDLNGAKISCAIMVTHLNETDQRIVTVNGALTVEEWIDRYHIREHFDAVYLSSNPCSVKMEKLLLYREKS